MSNSTDKSDIKDLAFQAPENQEALAPDAGTVLDAETLDAISAGGNASSSDHELLEIRRAQDEARTKARDAYRDAHRYMHPDDVEKVLDSNPVVIGFQG
jgi:hypothetical protein